ncbi:hypothetical protein [Aquipuribacter hungaricus]|uniref:DUF4190 domain-containing protein n=1 Tax=Aquipuribacter hungaricus TaxID=545624 RepID=A0ABV7WCE0_9MICO
MTTPPEGQQPPPGPSDEHGAGPVPPTGPYGAPPAGPDPYAPPPAGGYGTPPAGDPGGYGTPSGTPGGYGVPYGGTPGYGAPGPAGYGPGGYGPPPGGQTGADGPSTDVVSVVGLVLAFLLAPVGLVLSIVGLVRTAGGKRKGRGLAVAGLVVSVLLTVLGTVAVVAAVNAVREATDDLGTTIEELEDTFPTDEPFPSLDALPSEEPSVVPPPVAAPSEPAAPAAVLPLGQGADLGPLRVTVTGVDLEADAAVAAEEPENPAPGGRYVVVTGTVENTGTEAEGVYLGLNVGYVSAAGALYDELTCDAVVLGAPALAPDLEPGASAEHRWCFDVPVDEVGGGTVQAAQVDGAATASWGEQ